MSDIYRRVGGSWDSVDAVRHVYYETVFGVLSNLVWQIPLRLIEIGARDPTTPIIRMMKGLMGDHCDAQVANYPAVDIQKTNYQNDEWDVLVADQVLEHVQRPWLAADEIWRVVRPGGTAIIATPFILPIHPNPLDCWRIAPDGYKVLFPEERWEWIEFGSWGNQEIVRQAYSSPHLRGFSGDWVPFERADELLPALYTPADNLHPVIYWWIGKKR